MNRSQLAVALLAVAATGCATSSVTRMDDPEFAVKVNERASAHKAKVVLRTGATIWTRGLRVEGDSVSFLKESTTGSSGEETPAVGRLATESIWKVEFRSGTSGIGEGMAFGSVVGFGLGFAFGAAVAQEPDTFGEVLTCASSGTCGEPTSVGLVYGLSGAVVGAAIGAITGGIAGKPYIYEFSGTNRLEPSPAPEAVPAAPAAISVSVREHDLAGRIKLKSGEAFSVTKSTFFGDFVRFSGHRDVPQPGGMIWRKPVEETVAIADIESGLKDRVYQIELENGSILLEVRGLTASGDKLYGWVSKEKHPYGLADYTQPVARTIAVSEITDISYRLEDHERE